MELDNLFIHDSLIKSVIENPKLDEIVFIIDWPGENLEPVFIEAKLIFENVLNYEVHEGPFDGEPTILELIEDGKRVDYNIERIQIRIETTAGYRSLYCTNVKLIRNK